VPATKSGHTTGEKGGRKRCQPPNLGRMSDGHDGGSPMTIEQLAAAVLTTLLCGTADMVASSAS